MNVTLGQYYPANTLIHNLDPRVKIIGTLIYIISLFAFKGASGLIIQSIFLILVLFLSRLPIRLILRQIRGIYILCAVTALFNIFFTPGEALVASGNVTIISDQGVINAVLMTIRLIYLVIGTSIMTLSTTPSKLTDGLEKVFAPLQLFKVPVSDIAMTMTIALRFIPILTQEAGRIKRAQTARGADFENGSLIKRAKTMLSILVPLFVSAFRRADELATAMEARAYHGGAHRGKLHPLHYERIDIISYVVLGVYFACGIILR